MRWKQLSAPGLKVLAQPGDHAKPVVEEKAQVVEHDPVFGKLYFYAQRNPRWSSLTPRASPALR